MTEAQSIAAARIRSTLVEAERRASALQQQAFAAVDEQRNRWAFNSSAEQLAKVANDCAVELEEQRERIARFLAMRSEELLEQGPKIVQCLEVVAGIASTFSTVVEETEQTSPAAYWRETAGDVTRALASAAQVAAEAAGGVATGLLDGLASTPAGAAFLLLAVWWFVDSYGKGAAK